MVDNDLCQRIGIDSDAIGMVGPLGTEIKATFYKNQGCPELAIETYEKSGHPRMLSLATQTAFEISDYAKTRKLIDKTRQSIARMPNQAPYAGLYSELERIEKGLV